MSTSVVDTSSPRSPSPTGFVPSGSSDSTYAVSSQKWQPSCSRALRRRADVAEARLDEQLEPPRLDPRPGPRPDRLAREDHALVRREHLGRGRRRARAAASSIIMTSGPESVYQPVGRSSRLKRKSCSTSPGWWSTNTGVAPIPRIVSWMPRPAEREQAVHEVVAGPAAELPELADEHARPAPGVRRRRRVAGRARRREDRGEDLPSSGRRSRGRAGRRTGRRGGRGTSGSRPCR